MLDDSFQSFLRAATTVGDGAPLDQAASQARGGVQLLDELVARPGDQLDPTALDGARAVQRDAGSAIAALEAGTRTVSGLVDAAGHADRAAASARSSAAAHRLLAEELQAPFL